MTHPSPVRVVAAAVAMLVPTVLAVTWVHSAESRLAETERSGTVDASEKTAVAAAADEGYCTLELKRILRRVLGSCGLLDSGTTTSGGRSSDDARGCQPVDAKKVAQMSGDDFNALFLPMKERGGIIQFEQGDAELDADDLALIDRIFADQRGASYFFIVARASPEGSAERNRELSRQRAEGLMEHLRQTFNDPELDGEVGLLSLGEEYAQLDASYCDWRRSAKPGEPCGQAELNRSAFIAWVDCRL